MPANRPQPPATDFQGMAYREAAGEVMSDPGVSFVLKTRIAQDDKRDPVDALRDAELLHALQSMRFGEVIAEDAEPCLGDRAEEAGVAALRRLYRVARGHSGQCRYIARFLLCLYNGSRFPFDLTDLRAIDTALYDDCVRVLNMDARFTRREVHTYFNDGGRLWEEMARDWKVIDAQRLRQVARQIVENGCSRELTAQLEEILKGSQVAGE